MKLEVNKWYRTRSGFRAYVAARRPKELPGTQYAFAGWRECGTGDYIIETWTDEGSAHTGAPHDSDLVEGEGMENTVQPEVRT